MEKFDPFRKKKNNIAALVGTVGIGALSFLAENKLEQPVDNMLEPDSKNKIENRIEWSRDELEFEENTAEAMAFSLAIAEIMSEEYLKYIREYISSRNKHMEKLTAELKYRESNNGTSSKVFSHYTAEEILAEIEEEKNSLEYTKKELKDVTDGKVKIPPEIVMEKVNDIKKKIFFYDIGRQWVLDNMQDSEFSHRLKNELKDTTLTEQELKEYVEKMKSNRIRQATDENFIFSKDIEKSYGEDGEDVAAFYSLSLNTVFFPIDIDSVNAVNYAIHEYAHKITKGNKFISSKAIALFGQAFDSLTAVSRFCYKEEDTLKILSYYSDPTEMYARKKVFEHDLENLGVKKYGEKFTEKHYNKVIKLFNENKLSRGSREFVLSIKLSMMIRVMNEIADADFDEEKFKEIA